MKRCWPSLLFWAVVALLGIGAMLSGCGQKGPLYLPDDNNQTQDRNSGR